MGQRCCHRVENWSRGCHDYLSPGLRYMAYNGPPVVLESFLTMPGVLSGVFLLFSPSRLIGQIESVFIEMVALQIFE